MLTYSAGTLVLFGSVELLDRDANICADGPRDHPSGLLRLQ